MYTVKRFDESNRHDFYHLHSEENEAGWCRCMAWWVPTWSGWSARSAEENRETRDRLCDMGIFDGYLLYAAREPIGWCQVGQRDRLEKLVTQFGLEPDPEVWAITCFQIAPRYRRRGLASFLLAEILHDLPGRGVTRVEAYARRGVTDPEELWTGPEKIYLASGFSVDRHDEQTVFLSLTLSAPATDTLSR